MERHVIFFFTGTGNSLKSALTIARKLEGSEDNPNEVRIVCMGPDEPFSFGDTAGSLAREVGSVDSIGFVFPCHFWSIPQRVLEFVRTLDLSGQQNAYCYAVVTCGGYSFGTLDQLNAVLTEKGHALDYGAALKAFSTYVIGYRMASDKLSEKTALLKSGLEPVIADISSHHTMAFKPLGVISKMKIKAIDSSDTKKADANYVVSNACAGCGQCTEICSVSNITLEGDPPRPRWQHRCTQCLACLHLCPNEAINFGSKTRGRGRYKHPEITVQMLIAYNHNHPETLEQRY